MTGGATIPWTEAERLAASGCAIILYFAGLWFLLRWMATRHTAPDTQADARSEDPKVEQHHHEGSL